jgi:hypothetical protein
MICMNRPKLNLYLDILILTVFVTVAITSILKYLNMSSLLVRNIHNYFGWVLILLLSVHFLLHVEWIVTMLKAKTK